MTSYIGSFYIIMCYVLMIFRLELRFKLMFKTKLGVVLDKYMLCTGCLFERDYWLLDWLQVDLPYTCIT